MSPATNTRTTALDIDLQRLPMILDKIEAPRQLADDHTGNGQEVIHWDHIADLGQVQALDKQQAIYYGQANRGKAMKDVFRAFARLNDRLYQLA